MPTINLNMLGPCGIYCGSCDIHVAGATGDRATQDKIALWLKEHHNADVRPEQIRCGGCWGCLSEHWSADCTILKCVKARGIKLCCGCGEYETCTTLETFYQGGDYQGARATLKRIREIGVEAWARERERGDTA